MIKISILFTATLVLISCGKNNGEIITTNHDLSPFHSIELNGVFDVELIEDNHFSIQISGSDAVTKDLTFEVVDQLLNIDNTDTKLWLNPKLDPPLLTISGKGLKFIDVNETCNIKTLNTITTDTFGIVLGGKLNIATIDLDTKWFYYWNTAPNGGKVTLTGKAGYVQIYNSTLMSVDASQLPCDGATVETNSKSDVRVFVRNKLEYSITGTGNIYLKGNPSEIIPGELASTGRLIHL